MNVYLKSRVQFYNLDGGHESFAVDDVDVLKIDSANFIRRLINVVNKGWEEDWSFVERRGSSRHEQREHWVDKILRFLCLCLGVKLRCVLARDPRVAEFHARNLLVELQCGVHLDLSPRDVVDVIGLQNIFVAIRQRRMVDLRDMDGHEMHNDPALHVNFLPTDSSLSDYARAYEWLRWPDLMSFVGEIISSLRS